MPHPTESCARRMARKGGTSHCGIAPGIAASHDRTTNTAATSQKATSMLADEWLSAPFHWGPASALRDCEHWHMNRNRKDRANSPADSEHGALTVAQRVA